MQLNSQCKHNQTCCSPDNAQNNHHSHLKPKPSVQSVKEFDSTDDNFCSNDESSFSPNRSIEYNEKTSIQPHLLIQRLVEQTNNTEEQEQPTITHECGCMQENCDQAYCNCFLTPHEICVKGLCCPKCIEIKNQYLRSTRGFKLQAERLTLEELGRRRVLVEMLEKNCTNMHYLRHINPHDPFLKNLTFCTCKKSHCQKKYCLCYERGLKCGKFCFCDDCENHEEVMEEEVRSRKEELVWERYAIMKVQPIPSLPFDLDISSFLDDPELMEEEDFQEAMDFEPADLSPFFQ